MKNIARNIDKQMGIIVALVLIIILLYFVNFELSNNLFIQSLNLTKTEQNIDTYSHENNSLKLELLQKESYTQIASEAATMGFRQASFIIP